MSKRTGMKTTKVLNRVFIAFSTISALTFIGLIPSQAMSSKTAMLLGQIGNSKPSAVKPQKVLLAGCVWVYPPGYFSCK